MSPETCTSVRPARNQSMECFKMVAAVLVVFNHIYFPGEWYSIVDCLCRPAVPFFFAVTGYFNYQASAQQIKRRLIHIIELNILADLFHIFWTCVLIEWEGGSTIAYLRAAIPDANEFLWWVIYQQNSFLGHLWYLASMGLVYLIYWGYVQFFGKKAVNYRPLYYAGFLGFSLYFLIAIIMPVAGAEIPGLSYRNGWLLGLPMFTLGLFLRQYQDPIFENFPLTPKKLTAALILSIAMIFFQWKVIDILGSPFALPFAVIALMLLCIRCPLVAGGKNPAVNWLVGKFGAWSTGLYLFHLTVAVVYDAWLQPGILARVGELEAWLRPPIVLVMTFLVAVLWERADTFWKTRKKKTA